MSEVALADPQLRSDEKFLLIKQFSKAFERSKEGVDRILKIFPITNIHSLS